LRKKTASLILGISAFLLIVAAVSALFLRQEKKTENRSFFSMDTYVTVSALGGDPDKIVSTIESLSSALDMHSGILSEANGTDAIENSDIYSVAVETLRLNGIYGNDVDITSGALTSLWNVNGENPEVPDDAEIEKALSTIGTEKLRADDGILYKSKDTVLDFGSVAKGYALDRVYDGLVESDAEYAIVSTGSSSLLYGEKPDGSPFRIEIKNPDGSDTPLGMIQVGECFISTSGGYERFFTADGKKYCHILDLSTGYPTESDLVSVTVISDKSGGGIETDFLSTMIFLGGTESLDKHLSSEEYSVVAADSDGNIYVSEGLDFTLYDNNGYSLCE